jgi:hypothetical protein
LVAVEVDAEMAQVLQEQRAVVAVVLAVQLVKPEVQVHLVRDLRVEALARTLVHTAALAVVDQVQQAQMGMRDPAQVAQVLPTSLRRTQAAVVVETL